MNENVTTGKTSTLAILFVIVVVAGFVFALIITGNDDKVDHYLTSLAVAVPGLVGLLYVSRQNNDIRSSLNGKLTDQFLALHNKIDTNHAQSTDGIAALTTRVDRLDGSNNNG